MREGGCSLVAFLEGGFVKSSLLLFLDNGEREMEGTTKKREVRRHMDSITGRAGDVHQLLVTILDTLSVWAAEAGSCSTYR